MSSKESVAIGQLLSLLESRYAMRVLWALRDGHAQTFRLLQDSVGGITPNTLNTRIKELREAGLMTHGSDGYAVTNMVICRRLLANGPPARLKRRCNFGFMRPSGREKTTGCACLFFVYGIIWHFTKLAGAHSSLRPTNGYFQITTRPPFAPPRTPAIHQRIFHDHNSYRPAI
jgi:hypothetical protein